jgi:DNA-binding transcriptional MerR regulator
MIPDTVERVYFSTTEVSKAISVTSCKIVTSSKIRYWDKYFGFSAKRGNNNDRKYTVNDVARMALIARLSEHLHLHAVKQILRQNAAESILEILEPNQVKEPVMKIA